MSTVDDLIAVDYGNNDSSSAAASNEDSEDESSSEQEVIDIDKLDEQQGEGTCNSIDNQETEDDAVGADALAKAPAESKDSQPQPTIDEDENVVLTQRDWRRKFSKQNPLYKRCKIRYTQHCYIKPRTAIPATGKPVLYVAEGCENWTGSPNLLCSGQLVFCDKDENPGCDKDAWVIIVVLWIGCLTRQRPNGVPHYSPAAKNMKVLLCPEHVFDTEGTDLNTVEGELRYIHVLLFVTLVSFFYYYVHSLQAHVGL